MTLDAQTILSSYIGALLAVLTAWLIKELPRLCEKLFSSHSYQDTTQASPAAEIRQTPQPGETEAKRVSSDKNNARYTPPSIALPGGLRWLTLDPENEHLYSGAKFDYANIACGTWHVAYIISKEGADASHYAEAYRITYRYDPKTKQWRVHAGTCICFGLKPTHCILTRFTVRERLSLQAIAIQLPIPNDSRNTGFYPFAYYLERFPTEAIEEAS